MLNLKSIVFMTLVTGAINAFAQTSDSTYIPKSEIKISYLGSIKYPGFRLGVESPLRLKRIVKTDKSKTILKVTSLTLNLGFYHQKDFHDNIYFTSEWQLRRIGPSGCFSEFSPGIGFSRTFLGGTTYKVSDNGEVTTKKLAGYNYAMLTLAIGFGYDFSIKKKQPIKIFSKLSVISMFPYNSFIYARPTAELGFTYTPKLFIGTNPSIKTKRK